MKLEVGAEIGIYTVLKELGRKQRPNHKKETTDLFYWVICSRCESEKEVSRNILRPKDGLPPFYCSNCSREQKAQGRKEKKAAVDKGRRDRGRLNESEKELWRTALFGDRS